MTKVELATTIEREFGATVRIVAVQRGFVALRGRVDRDVRDLKRRVLALLGDVVVVDGAPLRVIQLQFDAIQHASEPRRSTAFTKRPGSHQDRRTHHSRTPMLKRLVRLFQRVGRMLGGPDAAQVIAHMSDGSASLLDAPLVHDDRVALRDVLIVGPPEPGDLMRAIRKTYRAGYVNAWRDR